MEKKFINKYLNINYNICKSIPIFHFLKFNPFDIIYYIFEINFVVLKKKKRNDIYISNNNHMIFTTGNEICSNLINFNKVLLLMKKFSKYSDFFFKFFKKINIRENQEGRERERERQRRK